MFWWFDPAEQKIYSTHPFTTNAGKGIKHFTTWPTIEQLWWSPWGLL